MGDKKRLGEPPCIVRGAECTYGVREEPVRVCMINPVIEEMFPEAKSVKVDKNWRDIANCNSTSVPQYGHGAERLQVIA